MNQILCIGSVNLDHTYPGSPHRPARRDPSPAPVTAATGAARAQPGPRAGPGGADAHLAARVSAADLPALAALGAENGLDTALTEGCASPPATPLSRWTAAGRTASSSTPGPTPPWTGGFVLRRAGPFGPGDLLLLQNEVRDVPGILSAARSRG